MNGASCLVTGGAGAIGSHLTEALLDLGARVDVLDDLSSGRLENLPADKDLCFIRADITDPGLKEIIAGRRYDYVFHLAAHFANSLSIHEPERDLRVNILGLVNLLQALDLRQVRKFIFASSSTVYGHYDCAVESPPIRAEELDTPYALSKYACESLLHFWTRSQGLQMVILRYFNSYGPRDWAGPSRGVVPRFFALAMAGRPLTIKGTGREVRDFTYVADIVRATINAASSEPVLGRALNVGSGKGVTILRLAEEINNLVGNQAGIEFLPARSWDRCPRRIANLNTSATILDLSATTNLAEGLASTYAWIRGCKDFASGAGLES